MKTVLRTTVVFLGIIATMVSLAGARPASADPNTCPGVGPVNLAMIPQSTPVNPGDEFDLVLQVQAGVQEVDVVSAYVGFDPTLFQVVSVAPGSSLPVVLNNTFDNTLGTFDYEAGKLGSPFPTGTFTLATVHFQLVVTPISSPIIYQCGAPRTTEVFRNGNSVLGTLQNAFVPTGVTLDSFQASAEADHILVSWQTVSEIDNQSFNLYRSMNPVGPGEMIGFIPSQAPGSTQGYSYEWRDTGVGSGRTYYYWLEDVDLLGNATLHGPVSATYQIPTAVTSTAFGAEVAHSPSLPLVFLALFAGLILAVYAVNHAARRNIN